MDFIKVFLVVINFAFISLATIFSISSKDIFYKQLIFWIVGIILFLISARFIDYRGIFKYPYREFWILISLLSLVIVLFSPGYPKSWLRFGSFSLQTSEFAKIGLFILLTSFLTKYADDLRNPFYLILLLILVSPFFIFLILQPDFGMALLYFLIVVLSIIPFLTRKEILFGFCFLFLVFILLWFFILKDYQKARIINFMNPSKDPLKSGYNLRQLKITVGSAGFYGKGVGRSEIAKYGFLPAKDTDFALASLIEERGLVGYLIYAFLMGIILYEIKRSQSLANEAISSVFLYLVFVYFFIKFSLTTFINFGLFPIIGLPAPFLSAGGSHLVFDLWILGIASNLTRS